MTEQPNALRLADALEVGTYLLHVERDTTAAELRRLHEANAELLAALQRIATAADGAWCNVKWVSEHARAAIAKASGGQ